jgi:hypothetical protein
MGQPHELWLSAATRFDPRHPFQDTLTAANSSTLVLVTSP